MEGQHQNSNNKNHDLFEGIQLQCPFFEPAFQYCCEQNCKSNAVVCIKSDCKCKQSHKNCISYLNGFNLKQKINNKIITPSLDNYKEIEKNTDKIIDKVSQMLDQINLNLKTFGLNQSEESMKDSLIGNFMNIGQIQDKKKLIGDNLFKWRTEQKSADKNWFKYSMKKYTTIVKQTKKMILPLFDQIEEALTYMHSIHIKDQFFSNYLNNSAIAKQNINFQTFKQDFSNIITKNLDVKAVRKIYTFLKPPQGKTISNLIRQPQEILVQEQMEHFKMLYEALKEKSNLIFLVCSKTGNKYGAYTPCLVENNNEWKKDDNNSSFLFSIDSKFSQKLCEPQKGLRFGLQNIQVGNTKSIFSFEKKNGFQLAFKKGQFVSKIRFCTNPNKINNNQMFGGLVGQPTAIYNQSQIAESLVSILEIYQLQLQGKPQITMRN